MKNRFKKLTSFITALCIILCSVSIMPVQASGKPTIYLIGDSLLSKIIVGGIADKSWDMANLTMVIGAALGVLLCILTVKSEKQTA